MTRNEDLLDRNLSRLVQRWADAPSEERTARARQAFLKAATAPSPESPSQRRWGLIATAAGLLICALVYGSLFLAGPGRSGRTGQSQDEAKIKALIEDLGHADVLKRDRAAIALAALGSTSRPLLQEAQKAAKEDVRVRAKDILDRMASPAGSTMIEQLNALDAECSAKAARILDLQRQLDAANTLATKKEADQAVFERQLEVYLAQIQELQKKLEEAQKK